MTCQFFSFTQPYFYDKYYKAEVQTQDQSCSVFRAVTGSRTAQPQFSVTQCFFNGEEKTYILLLFIAIMKMHR